MKVTVVVLMVCVSMVHANIFQDTVIAVVNKPVTLPCTCFGKEVKWTIFYPTKKSIAMCQNGLCWTEQQFQERFSVLRNISTGNSSISITPAVYNDFGYYRCTCDNNSTDIKLMVYDPRIVEVCEGENIILPCYGDTRSEARDAQWKKDGEVLLEYPRVITNEVSGSRFTMTEKGFQDGDLSLHISSVQLSDAALYLCLIQGESRDGDPRAVLLNVKECQPEHQLPTPCNRHTRVPLGVLLCVLVLISCIGVIYCVRRCQDARSTNPGFPVQEQASMFPKDSSTHPFN